MPGSRNDRSTKPRRKPASAPPPPPSADLDFSRADVRQRFICTGFKFWLLCREGQCQRRRACAGDAKACFRRNWWRVSEADKIHFRTVIKSRLAGMSHEEACRVAVEEVARSADHIARVDAQALARLRAENAARHGK